MGNSVKQRREANHWSQEQLAEMTGLSVRTIQRIEKGQNAGLESWKALSAVFKVSIAELQGEITMHHPTPTSESELDRQEMQALKAVRALRDFYQHIIAYILVMFGLLMINLLVSDHLWVVWPALGWGIGLASHAMRVFGLPWKIFDDEWERKAVEKRINRKI